MQLQFRNIAIRQQEDVESIGTNGEHRRPLVRVRTTLNSPLRPVSAGGFTTMASLCTFKLQPYQAAIVIKSAAGLKAHEACECGEEEVRARVKRVGTRSRKGS